MSALGIWQRGRHVSRGASGSGRVRMRRVFSFSKSAATSFRFSSSSLSTRFCHGFLTTTAFLLAFSFFVRFRSGQSNFLISRRDPHSSITICCPTEQPLQVTAQNCDGPPEPPALSVSIAGSLCLKRLYPNVLLSTSCSFLSRGPHLWPRCNTDEVTPLLSPKFFAYVNR